MKKRNTKIARKLRSTQTPQEAKVWARLRNRQFHDLKFRRQHVINNYIVDFICLEKKLIIEIDGWQHKEEFSGIKEEKRTLFLQELDYVILRFWNNDIDQNIEGIFSKIDEAFNKL